MEKWKAKADAFAAFIAERGRHPERKSADPRERRLHVWMLNQRAARVGRSSSSWSPQRQEYLDWILPGWDHDRHDTWRQHADRLTAFVAEHGGLPQQRSADILERRLWYWLRRQRDTLSTTSGARSTVERREHLDRHVPAWASETI
ncbi:hypothetical protein [Microbacterium sp. NPDC055665]